MNQDAWNKAMETIGIPKQRWDGMRERFIKVLLVEHETILSSYRAQKYGGGEGLTGEVAQVSRTLGKNWQEEGRETTSTRSEVKRASS